MRFALAGWLAAATAAAARDIPVYREYTVPISFAAEPEAADAVADLAAADVAALDLATADFTAPDLIAHRELREAPSRDALLGKEKLLDLGAISAASARGDAAPVPGKLTPTVVGDRRRGDQDKSSRNWLADSLTLPTLGQTASNTAAAAMGRDQGESSRGWLVDEMAKASGAPELPQDQWRQELEGPDPLARAPAPAADEAKGPSGGAAPTAETAAKRTAPAWEALGGLDSGRSAATWPNRIDAGPSDSYRDTLASAGGMSQTRKLIAEYTGGARPDFAALRASLVQANPAVSGADKAPSAVSFGAASAGNVGRSVFGATPAVPSRSWQGGWRGAGLGSSASTLAEPLPAPVVPAAVAPHPVTTSGGYKPAWY